MANGAGGRLAGLRRLPWVKIVLFGVGGFVLFVVVAFGVAYLTIDIPPVNDKVTAQSTELTYTDGSTLARIGSRDRTDVPLDKVPKAVRQAVLAAEDRDYYDEPGISFSGIFRALWADVRGGEIAQGGSTITQQYAKNAYLTQDRTFSRKFKEIIIAIKLDRQRSKNEVLEDYLNTIYFGRGAYGIEAASRAYFGASVDKLDYRQGAVLAGLIRAPAFYDPADHPDAAHKRWHYVLSGMVGMHAITAEQAHAATYPAVAPPSTADRLGGPAGYLVVQAENELARHGFSEDRLRRSGLVVQTTIDPRMQAAAVKAVTDVLGGTPHDLLSPLVAIAPGTGAIKAEYAGRDYVARQFNAATQGVAQAGSSFKPYVLAAALQQGIGLRTRYDSSSPQTFGRDYTVHNYDDEEFGRINLLEATAKSVNTVFVPLAIDAGLANVRQVAQATGITTTIPKDDASIALGSVSVHPVDQAEAYATFAAQGVHADAHIVSKVLDHDGQVLYQAAPKPTRVFSAKVAADLTYALQGVVAHGTATRAQLAGGRPAAGKTGTTSGNTAAWFCGYTPQLATAVGMFYDPIKALQGLAGVNEVVGGSLPARIWKEFTDAALSGAKVEAFPPPAYTGRTHRRAPDSGSGQHRDTSHPANPPATTNPPPTAGPSGTPSASATGSPPASQTPGPSATATPSASPSASATSSPTGSASPTQLPSSPRATPGETTRAPPSPSAPSRVVTG